MDDFNVINYSCLFPVFTSQNVCCFTSTLRYTKRSFDLFVLIVGYQLNASCDLGLFGEQSQRVWDELNMQSNAIPKICLTIQLLVVATCYQMRHTVQKQHQNVTKSFWFPDGNKFKYFLHLLLRSLWDRCWCNMLTSTFLAPNSWSQKHKLKMPEEIWQRVFIVGHIPCFALSRMRSVTHIVLVLLITYAW